MKKQISILVIFLLMIASLPAAAPVAKEDRYPRTVVGIFKLAGALCAGAAVVGFSRITFDACQTSIQTNQLPTGGKTITMGMKSVFRFGFGGAGAIYAGLLAVALSASGINDLYQEFKEWRNKK